MSIGNVMSFTCQKNLKCVNDFLRLLSQFWFIVSSDTIFCFEKKILYFEIAMILIIQNAPYLFSECRIIFTEMMKTQIKQTKYNLQE